MAYRRIVLQRGHPAVEHSRAPRRRRLSHSHSSNRTITSHTSHTNPRGSVYRIGRRVPQTYMNLHVPTVQNRPNLHRARSLCCRGTAISSACFEMCFLRPHVFCVVHVLIFYTPPPEGRSRVFKRRCKTYYINSGELKRGNTGPSIDA